ncbi:MAG TPA: hypothetical protein VGN83_15855 [Falsiroseomonas sp.]|jgi:hypothetical protein|nr:hypothetical protein [Falsiroseomonas sp.]
MAKIEFRSEGADAPQDAAGAAYAEMKRRMDAAWKGDATTAPATPAAAPGDARTAMKRQMSEAWKETK